MGLKDYSRDIVAGIVIFFLSLIIFKTIAGDFELFTGLLFSVILVNLSIIIVSLLPGNKKEGKDEEETFMPFDKEFFIDAWNDLKRKEYWKYMIKGFFGRYDYCVNNEST